MAVTHPVAFRNTVADAVDTALGTTAKLVFRASPSTAASPGAEVATLSMANPAFGSASNGIITADTITEDSSATGGTVAYATLETGAGTVVVHCAVAAAASDINMTGGLTVGVGDTVQCSALTYEAMP